MAAKLNLLQVGYRLMKGESINQIIRRVNGTDNGDYKGTFNGTVGATIPAAGSFTTLTRTGYTISVPQTLAAAGATQGDAAAITSSVVMVTVTASTEGVKLPTAATGLQVTVCAASAKGCKVWPFAGDRIQGAATNAAIALVLNKSSIFIAADAVNWRVVKGA